MVETDAVGLEPKSRTQKKKEDRALQQLGERLVGLTTEQMAVMDLPEELVEAVKEARGIKAHGARRRQMQYIGTLMRRIDPAPVIKALENVQLGDLQKARLFKRIENWRNALKGGDYGVIEKIVRRFPQTDRQRLSQLARNAHRNAGTGKGKKASKALFRYIKEISEL